MLSSTTALACPDRATKASAIRASARPDRTRWGINGVMVVRGSTGAIHVAWIEVEDHVAPQRVFGFGQLVGLALVDGPDRAVGRGLEERRRAAISDDGISDESPILVELEPQLHHDLIGAKPSGRRRPAIGDAGPKRVDLVHRHGDFGAVRLTLHLLRRRAVIGHYGLRVVGSVGDLIEQRGDLVWIEVALLCLSLRLLRRIGSGLLWVLCRLVILLLRVGFGRSFALWLGFLVVDFVVQRQLFRRLGFLCGFRLLLLWLAGESAVILGILRAGLDLSHIALRGQVDGNGDQR